MRKGIKSRKRRKKRRKSKGRRRRRRKRKTTVREEEQEDEREGEEFGKACLFESGRGKMRSVYLEWQAHDGGRERNGRERKERRGRAGQREARRGETTRFLYIFCHSKMMTLPSHIIIFFMHSSFSSIGAVL